MTKIILDGVKLIDGFTPNPIPQPQPIPFPPGFDFDPIRPVRPIRPFPIPIFKECTPKILVITDNLSFSSGSSFGLTEFVDSIKASTIQGMTPRVITAQYNPAGVLSYNSASQHISNYHFTDNTHGLLKSRYDVVFILSISGGNGTLLASEAGALDRIVDFMEAGGGLFCTGDHSTLGAGMCADIPRVNKMRKWFAGVPSGGGSDRLTTTAPGINEVYEFNDQSDAVPQRLYANYRSVAGGFNSASPFTGAAHPLLQMPNGNRVIEVFPDHAHEGECLVPTSSAGSLPNGSPEWPNSVLPEMVALSMSHGNGYFGKQAVEPKAFTAISAYDGHEADVGRVATDATWHHFVNINIKPGMADIAGQDLIDIKQYYANLADWLMPKNVRRCLRFTWILSALATTELFEELPNAPLSKLSTQSLEEIGNSVRKTFRSHHTKAQTESLMQDNLEQALGEKAFKSLQKEGDRAFIDTAQLVALGTFSMAAIERFNFLVEKGKISEKPDLNGEKAFARVGDKEISRAFKMLLEEERKKLDTRAKSLSSLSG